MMNRGELSVDSGGYMPLVDKLMMIIMVYKVGSEEIKLDIDRSLT